jgi:hypothetical protein
MYEPTCRGLEHTETNAALLATVLAACPGEDVAFFAEQEHLAELRKCSTNFQTENRVRWHTLEIAPRQHYTVRKRLRTEWAVCRRVLGEASHSSATGVILCCSTAASLLALKVLMTLRYRSLQVLAVQHSVLNSISHPAGRHLPARPTIYGLVLTRWPLARLRYLVLGNIIREAALRVAPSLRGQLFTLWIPRVFWEAPVALPAEGQPLRFVFPGVATYRKGFPAFCRMAWEATASSTSVPFTFELIGHISDPDLREALQNGALGVDVHKFVRLPETNTFLDSGRYHQQLSGATYAVFPHEPISGALISSGSVLDAFAHAIPCIVLRNPVFEDYFTRMGDIGYLCDSYEEMQDTIKSLLRGISVERYSQQQQNILKGRSMFTPEALAPQFRKILFR